MTAVYDYEDLHHLVDRLTPEQARRLRLLVGADADLSVTGVAAVPDDAGLSRLIGAVDGPADLAERHDGYVRDRFSAPA